MTPVTKESLTARIAELEAGPRSLKEDYYLAVMRELLKHLPKSCEHRTTLDIFNPNIPTYSTIVCVTCGCELGDV